MKNILKTKKKKKKSVDVYSGAADPRRTSRENPKKRWEKNRWEKKRPPREKKPLHAGSIPLANLTDERNKAFASFPRAKFSKPAALRTLPLALSTTRTPPHIQPPLPRTIDDDLWRRSLWKRTKGGECAAPAANEWQRDDGEARGRWLAKLRVLIRSFDTYLPLPTNFNLFSQLPPPPPPHHVYTVYWELCFG